MDTLKTLLFTTALAAVLGVSCTAKAQLQEQDCGDDMACWEYQANERWKAEHGEWQADLTAEDEQYIHEWLIKHYPNTDFYNP